MGWDNPPTPWREFERRLSWRRSRASQPDQDERGDEEHGQGKHGVGQHGASQNSRLAWAELHCHSSYSFLDGASSPRELVTEAAELGLTALAITDHDGMYGVPQFAQEVARLRDQSGSLSTVFGAELSLGLGSPDLGSASRGSTSLGRTGLGRPGGAVRAGNPDPAGRHLLVLARDSEGYGRLCRVISDAQLAGGEKGRPRYDEAALAAAHGGHWVILTGCRKGAVPAALTAASSPNILTTPAPPDAPDTPSHIRALRELHALIDTFGAENVKVELIIGDQPADDERNDMLTELAARAGVDTIATGNVHFAAPRDARLAQALAAIRARRSLDEMDGWLAAGGGGYLRSGEEMAARLRRYPGARERTVELAADCAFDFGVVAPRLPDFPVSDRHTEASWLRELTWQRTAVRYGPPAAERVPGAHAQVAHELEVIVSEGFPGYFLIVHDIVRFCEQEHILCQGRGSAANSAVCYALGITSVDPVQHGLLFERFLSAGRDGPPDIDLDIEHQRREEVIQYVYNRYGRDRAAQVANVISYRPRMALRDAGRALGYSPEEQDLWAKQVGPREYAPGQPVPPDAGVPRRVADLAERMQRLPRHLGIHSGGMVICDRPVGEVCPVEWARMPGRTVLQWD
ncbi:MAG TPA: PHP domain-containing protein, partial [Streptosporangiaceae bacterium]